MLNKINLYVIIQILKSCTLIFFIFLSIAWLLQITRLFTLTNFIQVDILSIIILSFFLIPNLLTVLIPFILIFGTLLCFLKLNRDKEIIAIYSLGFELKPIRITFIYFSFIILLILTSLNFYISPKIYKIYKTKEFELRNTIDFDKMNMSNFIKLNDNTTIDFEKNKNKYNDIFINSNNETENIIFAKEGLIFNNFNEYIFQLNDGFRISINENGEVEKLEFKNYLLKINNKNSNQFNNIDKNTLTIFDDLKNNNYTNMSYKFMDLIICVFILYFFYKNNIVNNNYNITNNIYFVFSSILILVINQFFKNSEIFMSTYLTFVILILLAFLGLIQIKRK